MKSVRVAAIVAVMAVQSVIGIASAQQRCSFLTGNAFPADCPMAAESNTCKSFQNRNGRMISVPMPATVKLDACSKLIDSGQFRGLELAGIYNERASVYREHGLRDFPRALADHDRAISMMPRYAGFYLSRSSTRIKQEDHAGSIQDLTRYIELSAEFRDKAFATYYRAEAYRKMGDRDRAIADYRAFLRMDAQAKAKGERLLSVPFDVYSRDSLTKLGASP